MLHLDRKTDWHLQTSQLWDNWGLSQPMPTESTTQKRDDKGHSSWLYSTLWPSLSKHVRSAVLEAQTQARPLLCCCCTKPGLLKKSSHAPRTAHSETQTPQGAGWGSAHLCGNYTQRGRTPDTSGVATQTPSTPITYRQTCIKTWNSLKYEFYLLMCMVTACLKSEWWISSCLSVRIWTSCNPFY